MSASKTNPVDALLWVDLETTGLDARTCHVLEVAAIATDGQLRELGRFEMLVRPPPNAKFGDLAAAVQAMHGPRYVDAPDHPQRDVHGLWNRAVMYGAAVEAVDAQLASWITQVGAAGAQLAGSTISFDRAFLASELPTAHQLLHYRNVDVTTLNELARRFWPACYARRPGSGRPPDQKPHRAMADVLETLELGRYFVGVLSAHTGEGDSQSVEWWRP